MDFTYKRVFVTMSDLTIQTSDANKTIVDSKLYSLAQETQLLAFLIPDLAAQMGTETEIDENFPRDADDTDSTRILINYRTIKGKSALYKFNDAERSQRTFDLDHFLNGYMVALGTEASSGDPIRDINFAILSALNMATNAILGLNDGPTPKATMTLCHHVLSSIVNIVYKDPLDVVIALNEMPMKDGEDSSNSVIAGIWVVKQRPADPLPTPANDLATDDNVA